MIPKWIPLADVLAIINNPEWTWMKNSRCKYINIHIDTRESSAKYHNGKGLHCTITDRFGIPITLAELAYQYGGEDE